MLAYLVRGHGNSCPAPTRPCTCEAALYVLTGALALFAGGISAWAGYYASAAVFSDAPHAWLDGTADFGAAFIVISAAPWLRKHNKRLFAGLLFIALAWIIYETWRRVEYPRAVVPAVALAAESVTVLIDYLRLTMLRRAEALARSDLRDSLIAHAKSDLWHGIIASALCILALLATTLGVNQELVRWADLVLSAVLVGYVSKLAFELWIGKEHSHGASPCEHHH